MKPIIKWNITAKAKIGCITNCIIGLSPMKCEASLNAEGQITDSELMIKCCSRNISKNKADKAIANFFPIDERNKDSFAIKQFLILIRANLEKLKSIHNEKCHCTLL